MTNSYRKLIGKVSPKQLDVIVFQKSFISVTSFKLTKDTETCIRSLRANMSDYAIGNYLLKPNDDYFLPVPYESTTLGLVSGYNLAEYKNQLERESKSNSGINKNVNLFDVEVYMAILLLFFVLFALPKFKVPL